MRTCLVVALFAAVLLPLKPVQARIGETEAEITARYGQSTGNAPDDIAKHFSPASAVRAYRKSGLVIFVAFWKKKSSAELFNHEDKSHLSGPEIDDLLAANRGEPTGPAAARMWRRADLGDVADGSVVWIRGDAVVEAHSATGFGFLEVQDVDFSTLINKTEQHPLSGF